MVKQIQTKSCGNSHVMHLCWCVCVYCSRISSSG